MNTHPTTSTLRQAIECLRDGVLQGSGDADISHLMRGLSSPEVLEWVSLAEDLGRVADVLRGMAAHEVDARTQKRPEKPEDSLAHSVGFGSAIELLKQLTLASGATLAKRVRQVKPCQPRVSLHGEIFPGKYPHIGAAFRQGLLSVDAVEMLISHFQKLPSTIPVERVDYVERILVSHATGMQLCDDAFNDLGEGVPQGGAGFPLHTDDLRQLTIMWMAVLDQEGAAPKEEQLTQRFFRIGQERDGLVRISGALVPEIAASLGRVIDAVTNPRTKDNRDSARDSAETSTGSRVRFVDADDTETQVRDTRTPDQKRHDVLATIIQTAMKHADMPHLGGEALSLTIQVTEDNLLDPKGIAWVHDHQGALTAVDAAAARHAGCVGSILRVTRDGAGRIVDLETHERVFTATQRKAIMLRDGGCIIPGCGQNPTWCEIHHVTEWQNDGKTHTDNGVMICWHHHRYLETNGWEIRMVDGIPEVKAPVWIDPAQAWRPARSVHKQPDPPWGTTRSRPLSDQNQRRRQTAPSHSCRVPASGMHLAPRQSSRTSAPPVDTVFSPTVTRFMEILTRPPAHPYRRISPRIPRMDLTTGPPVHIAYPR